MNATVRSIMLGAGAAATASRACAEVLDRAPASLLTHLARRNFRGEHVTLAEGIEVACALTAGALVSLGAKSAAAMALVGAVGLGDDVLEPVLMRGGEAPPKGLKGHVGALAHGRLTTGNVKILGIAAAAGVLARECASARGERGADASCSSTALAVVDCGLDTVLIAASANLANLFDLRPSRALKATTLGAILALAGPSGATSSRARARLASAHAAAMLLAAPRDFGARGMLGDAGANVLGANAGAMAALSSSRGFRGAMACVAVSLTLLSERVSFTRLIASSEVLTAIDEWGRS
ncbi:hypothetical protein [Dermabacter vaginalis]|uniref:Uncharacterized protein n=1 Tax=Dermabacter vaginalis TaxID=1630135 RepID=A0ABX6A696_9MICO|nr:hypothetical protein [Dermabacter vaginalis]QEU12086.1 hypothetical protein FOB48_07090 [Dermabacter vaginalis]